MTTRFTTRIFAAAICAAAIASAPAQVAADANAGYRTKDAREKIVGRLLAHDREDTQKPNDLVEAMSIAPNMTVVDIGTGAGFMLPYLYGALGDGGKLIAEDIFPDFLEKAKARAAEAQLENVTFIHGTEKDPKLPPAGVDVALILDAYHHFDYPADMLAGVRRGLKDNGRLILVDFYKRGFQDPKHIRADEAEVVREVEAAGFVLIATRPFTPDRQYIAEFKKK
ncbi:MAG: class I SAM-dependent methyltransferase [Bryobacteraceae bacterium]